MTAESSAGADEGGVDNENLIDEFVMDANLRGLSERTLETYRSNLGYFFEWLDGDPRTVDKQDLRKFLYHLRNEREGRGGSEELAQSTLNSYFSAMNTFYKSLQYNDRIEENLIPEFRDRYLDIDDGGSGSKRQLISVEEMSMLVHGTLDPRNRAIIVLFAKTGIRRDELIQIDLDHIDWEDQSIRLRPTKKRTNTLVFFDGECFRVLDRWLRARGTEESSTDALFTNQYGGRLKRHGVSQAVKTSAESVGLHDPDSKDDQNRFTPHCCRHWFTTHLRRAGMRREFIKELRGDTRGDAIDIYDHIDREELRESYIAHIPTLGI